MTCLVVTGVLALALRVSGIAFAWGLPRGRPDEEIYLLPALQMFGSAGSHGLLERGCTEGFALHPPPAAPGVRTCPRVVVRAGGEPRLSLRPRSDPASAGGAYAFRRSWHVHPGPDRAHRPPARRAVAHAAGRAHRGLSSRRQPPPRPRLALRRPRRDARLRPHVEPVGDRTVQRRRDAPARPPRRILLRDRDRREVDGLSWCPSSHARSSPRVAPQTTGARHGRHRHARVARPRRPRVSRARPERLPRAGRDLRGSLRARDAIPNRIREPYSGSAARSRIRHLFSLADHAAVRVRLAPGLRRGALRAFACTLRRQPAAAWSCLLFSRSLYGVALGPTRMLVVPLLRPGDARSLPRSRRRDRSRRPAW